MENKRTEMARNYYRRYRQKQFWRKIVSIMGCLVVFCTTYALILPAITMDEGTVCGMRQHQHTSDCYIMSEAMHVHTDACYVEAMNYICGLEETKSFFDELFDIYEESASSSALAYEMKQNMGHTHSEFCMEITMEQICGLEEKIPHNHTDECYDENGAIMCELSAEQKEPLLICDITPHIHSDGCFPSEKQDEQIDQNETDVREEQKLVCEVTAHQNEEGCYDASGNLICTTETHEHSDSCFAIEEKQNDSDDTENTDRHEIICGVMAHQHEEICYDADGNLICTLEEHEHGLMCYPKEELVFQILRASVYTDAGYTTLQEETEEGTHTVIQVSGRLPVKLQVKAYPVIIEQPDKEVVCAYDITLYREDGTIYEPNGNENITVAIQTPELNNENLNSEKPVEVYYVPEEGEPEQVDATITKEGISFDTRHFSVYMVTRSGSTTYIVNTVKDAFLKDPAYENYYNSDSPIGTAGSFHIVAFEDANLKVHTNGNVLAKNLYTNTNFGTNNYKDELSYVQNYMKINGGSASSVEHILVLGSANTVESYDNGNSFKVRGPEMTSGEQVFRPKHIVHDQNTATAPFIDLNRVENEIRQLSSKFSRMSNANISELEDTGKQFSVIQLTKPSGVGVLSLTADQLDARGGNGNTIHMKGFESGKNGAIVVNVDCTDVSSISMPQAPIYVDGIKQNTNEVTEFTAGKVIWNFVNAENVVITTHLMTGMIIAPGATVNIPVNLNGTVVAENVTILSGESHRTDFTGTLIEADSEKKPHQITIQKHETGYVANTLSGARFKLFKYTQNAWIQINADDNIVTDDVTLTTDADGIIQLAGLDASVAYKLEEIKAPAGYISSGKPFYFWVKAASTDTAPAKPENFSGRMISPGNTLFVPNDKSDFETTSLQLEKLWKFTDGTDIPQEDIPVSEIKLNIYQLVNGIRPDTAYQTITLNADNKWTATVDNLPMEDKDANGNKVVYTYEVEENFSQNGYTVTYEKNDTIVTIINTKNVGGYELPETGGSGTHLYILVGFILIIASIMVLYNQKQYRREDV